MYVYIVEMCRWEDRENHSYTIGAWSKLIPALHEGISHARHRAGKYGPIVMQFEIDGNSVGNMMCRTEEQAVALYKELTGNDWKDSGEE